MLSLVIRFTTFFPSRCVVHDSRPACLPRTILFHFFSQHFKCMFVSVNFLSSLFAMQATKITASVYTFFRFVICNLRSSLFQASALHRLTAMYISVARPFFSLAFTSDNQKTHKKVQRFFFVRFYSWLSTRLSNCFNYNSRSSLLKKIELQ